VDRREVDLAATDANSLRIRRKGSPAKLITGIPRIREALSEGLDGSGRGEDAVPRTAQLIDFLNDLVSRSYAILYRAPKNFPGRGLLLGISIAAANTIRRCRLVPVASVCVFLGGALFSYFVMDYSPDVRAVLVPPCP